MAKTNIETVIAAIKMNKAAIQNRAGKISNLQEGIRQIQTQIKNLTGEMTVMQQNLKVEHEQKLKNQAAIDTLEQLLADLVEE